ncbi:putative bifunctional diguanylate cyclase/phosphodiesterase [Methylocucumis oryzae]|uniref:putative bifunctional diguanylate cyclase/phosphodiesterase n=1 Tax=Methylocucumis oryzae TaxID=1632867 RepID=UPI0006969FEE|nr:EAL domain-containing protein [Methylocucumis oryzae]
MRKTKIIGAEGLLRWRHPQRGLIPPADFIPLLEETGLIVNVGEWVIRQACKDFLAAELLGLRVSVNVSGVQFNDADFLAQVTELIIEESLPAKALELELTENIVINDPLATAEILNTLHGLGMRIAIDDFGTGYSSLAYLKSLPLDVLKIDQSFIRDLTDGHGNRAIVEASISLGKKLGLEIVAEGVETLAQLEILRQLDCEYAQGYYISKPVPKAEFIDLVIAMNGLSETST